MKTVLSEKVATHVQPLYDRLSDEGLLSRCTQGVTQNANESLHALIWRKCPKEVFVSRRRIHMAVVNAISEHNLGIKETQRIKASIRSERLSGNVEEIANKRDQLRKRKSTVEFKEIRKSKRQRKKYGEKSDYASGQY